MILPRLAPVLALVAGVGCSSTTSPTPSPAIDSGVLPVDAGPGTDSAATADTWTSYAAGFCKTYCTECHDAQDTTGRDFNVQAKVEAEKLVARCGVAATQDPSWGCASSPAAKQFPIGSGPKPSDAERARFAAWITAGAP
ncbi:MAG: hypothetical protein NVSMB47_14990 [Polyangiales bacterium]